MTLAGLIIFLLIGAVAGWLAGVIIKGVGFGLVGNIVVGVIGSLNRRLVVWPIGHRCWRTDRVNHRRSRRCDHPPRHCRADQASVAPSYWSVGGEVPAPSCHAVCCMR